MLSSRPIAPDLDDDIRDLIENSNAVIHIVDDTVTDPPSFSLAFEQDGRKSTLLLSSSASQQLTLFDMMKVLQELGFAVDYQEIR